MPPAQEDREREMFEYRAALNQRADDGSLPDLPEFAEGYWVHPSPVALRDMDQNDLSAVAHFAVYREGYGAVLWDDAVNICGARLREAVVFERSEEGNVNVWVYPPDFDGEHPAEGEGLNAPATVYLLQPNPDPKEFADDEWRDFLCDMVEGQGAQFLSWEPESGALCFKVRHFSGYGLSAEQLMKKKKRARSPQQAATTIQQQQQRGSGAPLFRSGEDAERLAAAPLSQNAPPAAPAAPPSRGQPYQQPRQQQQQPLPSKHERITALELPPAYASRSSSHAAPRAAGESGDQPQQQQQQQQARGQSAVRWAAQTGGTSPLLPLPSQPRNSAAQQRAFSPSAAAPPLQLHQLLLLPSPPPRPPPCPFAPAPAALMAFRLLTRYSGGAAAAPCGTPPPPLPLNRAPDAWEGPSARTLQVWARGEKGVAAWEAAGRSVAAPLPPVSLPPRTLKGRRAPYWAPLHDGDAAGAAQAAAAAAQKVALRGVARGLGSGAAGPPGFAGHAAACAVLLRPSFRVGFGGQCNSSAAPLIVHRGFPALSSPPRGAAASGHFAAALRCMERAAPALEGVAPFARIEPRIAALRLLCDAALPAPGAPRFAVALDDRGGLGSVVRLGEGAAAPPNHVVLVGLPLGRALIGGSGEGGGLLARLAAVAGDSAAASAASTAASQVTLEERAARASHAGSLLHTARLLSLLEALWGGAGGLAAVGRPAGCAWAPVSGWRGIGSASAASAAMLADRLHAVLCDPNWRAFAAERRALLEGPAPHWARCEALSAWLRSCLAPSAPLPFAGAQSMPLAERAKAIFCALLTGRASEAYDLAAAGNLHKLAMCIASASDPFARDFLREQVEKVWGSARGGGPHAPLRPIYALLAGALHSSEFVAGAGELHWLSHLLAHHTYGAEAAPCLADSLARYTGAVEAGVAPLPSPWWWGGGASGAHCGGARIAPCRTLAQEATECFAELGVPPLTSLPRLLDAVPLPPLPPGEEQRAALWAAAASRKRVALNLSARTAVPPRDALFRVLQLASGGGAAALAACCDPASHWGDDGGSVAAEDVHTAFFTAALLGALGSAAHAAAVEAECTAEAEACESQLRSALAALGQLSLLEPEVPALMALLCPARPPPVAFPSVPPAKLARLSLRYAAQLEAEGAWHWGVAAQLGVCGALLGCAGGEVQMAALAPLVAQLLEAARCAVERHAPSCGELLLHGAVVGATPPWWGGGRGGGGAGDATLGPTDAGDCSHLRASGAAAAGGRRSGGESGGGGDARDPPFYAAALFLLSRGLPRAWLLRATALRACAEGSTAVALPVLLELVVGAPEHAPGLGALAIPTQRWAAGALFALLAHSVAPQLLLRLRAARRASVAAPPPPPTVVLAGLFESPAQPQGYLANWGAIGAGMGGADARAVCALVDALDSLLQVPGPWRDRARLLRAAAAYERRLAASVGGEALVGALAEGDVSESEWRGGLTQWRNELQAVLARLRAGEEARRNAARVGRAPQEGGPDGEPARPLQQAEGALFGGSAAWGVSEPQARVLHALLDDLLSVG